MGLLRKKGKKKVEKSTKEKKDNTLVYKVLGGLTLLFSVFVFLASISYLFTWRSDQSILNSGISDFIFDFRNLVPQNFMGKLGAFLAHFFIYNGFGIGAFFIYPIFFIIGFNLYFNSKFRIRPKTTSKLMVTAIWVSLVCALLFSKTFPLLSGLLGYGVFLFSKSLVGTIGMVLILGLVTLFFLYVAFSIDVLESIKNKDFDLKIFKDQKLALKNNYKTSIETNGFWLWLLSDAKKSNLNFERIANREGILNSITINDIVKLANKYFDENYFRSVSFVAE